MVVAHLYFCNKIRSSHWIRYDWIFLLNRLNKNRNRFIGMSAQTILLLHLIFHGVHEKQGVSEAFDLIDFISFDQNIIVHMHAILFFTPILLIEETNPIIPLVASMHQFQCSNHVKVSR